MEQPPRPDYRSEARRALGACAAFGSLAVGFATAVESSLGQATPEALPGIVIASGLTAAFSLGARREWQAYRQLRSSGPASD
jgi:hypothetical protein